MDSTELDFVQILHGLRAGEQQAAQDIYLRYINQLVSQVATRLDRRYRHKIDPECVAHSAMKSFLIGCRDGEFDLQNWGMVYGLLATMTFRKTLKRIRSERALKNDDQGATTFEDWMQAGESLDPSQTLEVQELLEDAFARSKLDDRERQLVERVLDGYSTNEVADEFGVTRKTVERKVGKLRKTFEKLQEREARE